MTAMPDLGYQGRFGPNWSAGVALLLPCLALADARPSSPPSVGGVASLPALNIPVAAPGQEMWLSVQINQQKKSDATLVLKSGSGQLLVGKGDLRQWRMKLPEGATIMHDGDTYYPLEALAGLTYQVDEPNQALLIDAPANLFDTSSLDGSATDHARPASSPPGGFLNYDLFSSHTHRELSTNGVLEAGYYNRWGVGTGNFLAQDLNDHGRLIRIDTTWTYDQPARMRSTRLGDLVNSAGSWGGVVHLGGLQWASNFGTQPERATFPLPALGGEARLPSTVDLYINDALRLSQEVPIGPFTIKDMPVVTGQGEARLVVRDLLGREQEIVLPYYASPRLLVPGLSEYSYEMGFVRKRYGFASNEYGPFMVALTRRRGFSDQFTGEVHAELQRAQQSAGMSGVLLAPRVGVLSATLAGSVDPHRVGGLLGLGFERQGRVMSFAASTQLTTAAFVQLGQGDAELPARQKTQVSVSVPLADYGSIGLGYVHHGNRDMARTELFRANYGVSVGKLGFLNLSLLHSPGEHSRTTVNASLSFSLGRATSMSLAAQPGEEGASLLVRRGMPAGNGMGYRLLAQPDGDPSGRYEAAFSAQGNVGTYGLEVGRTEGETSLQGTVSGGVAMLGGNVFLSRRISDSFAVVQVPGYSNVRVYADNQVVARTDAEGNALLPRLRPYQQNLIRIEQADLAMDAQIDATDLTAVPYYRSGLVLPFPVRHSRGGLVTILLQNGESLPAGALVRVNDQAEEFPAGLQGEVYLTGLAEENRLRVSWHDQHCDIVVPYPATTDPLPQLGTYVCNGVKP